jgi:hypothetical protein
VKHYPICDKCVANEPGQCHEPACSYIRTTQDEMVPMPFPEYGVDFNAIMNGDSPWPLHEVLKRFIDLHRHVLQAHSCDRHGYELDSDAVDAARKILDVMGIEHA